jgi:hypothetical protein
LKVILLTGSHARHLYVVDQLVSLGCVVAHVMEEREAFVPQPPNGLEERDRINFIRHFRDRADSELRFFGEKKRAHGELPTLNVSANTLNNEKTIQWVKSFDADLLISYGIHKLSDEFLAVGPKITWNIHGGLSPWYRGNATLFWPFYHMRPNWAGMTVHQLTARLDGGDILHHSLPELEYGDGLHDVACKAVIQVAEDLKRLLFSMPFSELTYHKQRTAGKLYTSQDWQPQHLRVVYNLFNNDIVDHYLDGKLPCIKPTLIDAFSEFSQVNYGGAISADINKKKP